MHAYPEPCSAHIIEEGSSLRKKQQFPELKLRDHGISNAVASVAIRWQYRTKGQSLGLFCLLDIPQMQYELEYRV